MNKEYSNVINCLKAQVNNFCLPDHCNAHPILACILQENRIVYVNPDFESNYAFNVNELLQLDFDQIIHPEYVHIFASQALRLQQEKSFQVRIKIIDKFKNDIWVDLYSFAFTFDCRELVAILACDIDKYANVENEFVLTPNRFYLMIEDMTEMVEIETVDNILLYVNDAYCRYFGKSRDELIGANSNELIHQDSLDKVLDILRNDLTPEKPCAAIENRVIKGDGEIGWISWTVRGIFDDTGKIIGHQSVGRDIEELKTYQTQLKLSESRYRGIVEDQTELIVRIKSDSTLLFANEAYCRFWGLKLEDLLGKQITEMKNRGEKCPLEYVKALSRDNPVTIYQEKNISPGGQSVWLEWTARGFFDNYDRLLEIQMVGRNITDRKKAEEELQKTKDKLEIRVQERTTALSKANQELIILNNNMTNIFMNMPDGVIVVDECGNVSIVNNVLRQIWGGVTEEIIEIICGYIIEKNNLYFNMLFNENRSFRDIEMIFPAKNGDITCLASGIPIENQLSNSKTAVVIFHPIQQVHKLVNRLSGATARFNFSDIYTVSKKMKTTLDKAKQAAFGSGNILINGESGTGKEMFAQAIHNHSSRARGPFIAINCAAIPRELLGSELFGYSEGAFTGAKKGGNIGKFELASGGTIFLDEIGDMPIEQQAALLRVIQEKRVTRVGGTKVIPVDARVICATNKELLLETEKGHFRQDLYYRLNVININIPPLRERPEDIPVLIQKFMEEFNIRGQYSLRYIDSEVMYHLQKYHWPGNVRELQNIVERMIHFAHGSNLSMEHLPAELLSIPDSPIISDMSQSKQGMTIKQIRKQNKKLQEEQECRKIINLLNRYKGNITKTSHEMGIARSTLYAKMEKYRIDP